MLRPFALRAWWGCGYATEAAGACVQSAFDDHGLDEVSAVADAVNVASTRVLEKIGMHAAGPVLAYGREHILYRLRARDAPAACVSE